MRIDQGAADALIGCDIVVSSSPKASGTYGPRMRAVVNTAEMPTGDIVRHRDASLETTARLRRLERVVGADNLRSLDANRLSDALFGDTVFANVIMLGAAWQQGLVPVSSDGADARDRVERRCRRAKQAGFCERTPRRRGSGFCGVDYWDTPARRRRWTKSSPAAPIS